VLIGTRAIAVIVNPMKKAPTGKTNARHMVSRFISLTNADLETNSVHLVYFEKTAQISPVEGVSVVRSLVGEAENRRWKATLPRL